MPASRCIFAAPRRAVDSSLSPRSAQCLSPCNARLFSISSSRQKGVRKASKRGLVDYRMKKRPVAAKSARPPEPGERKAIRKRIVLSNTNALPVRNIEALSGGTVADTATTPKLYTLPNEVIDQLRAVEAFKPRQGWSFFQTPTVLATQWTKDLANDMDGMDKASLKTSGKKEAENIIRKVICGEKGTGKTVLMLQAMAMAFQRGWIVINLPDARELVSSVTAFAPVPGSQPIQYIQPNYMSNLLDKTLKANQKVLSTLRITSKPNVPFPVKDNSSLADLIRIGVDDASRAWPVFQIFWQELNKPNSSIDAKTAGKRPPVLMCLDNLSYVMLPSKYQVASNTGKLTSVHAHDLSLVRHFLDHLSGSVRLANGGMFLAATSASDAPKSEAMDVALAITQTKQNPKDVSYSTPYTELQKLAPDRDPNPLALSNFWSPFRSIDTRVLDALKNVDIVKMGPVSRGAALALMDYWARSGMYRRTVLPETLKEVKVLSGGGIVGELEQGVVRFLQRELEQPLRETMKKIRVH